MFTRTRYADKQGKVGLDVCATKKALGKFDTTFSIHFISVFPIQLALTLASQFKDSIIQLFHRTTC